MNNIGAGRQSLNEDMNDDEIAEVMAKYCPFCRKHIAPSNVADVFSGEHDGFIYVHDDVIHDEDYNFEACH